MLVTVGLISASTSTCGRRSGRGRSSGCGRSSAFTLTYG